MRTSRFASLVSVILMAILLTALVVGINQAVAGPILNFDITEFAPAVGQGMSHDHTVVLDGTIFTVADADPKPDPNPEYPRGDG